MSDEEKTLFFLPVKLGGLGISDPVSQAELSFQISRMASAEIVSAIKGDKYFSMMTPVEQISQARLFGLQECHSLNQKKLDSILDS